MKSGSCQCLRAFMQTQIEVINRHLDEHKYLRHIDDKNEAMDSFIKDYGWIIREIYCTKVCDKKENCEISTRLSQNGDLLRDKK